MTPVKNIIFDLGNVLYDIDFNNMYAQFDALGVPNFQNHFTLNKCDQLFYDVEKVKDNREKAIQNMEKRALDLILKKLVNEHFEW